MHPVPIPRVPGQNCNRLPEGRRLQGRPFPLCNAAMRAWRRRLCGSLRRELQAVEAAALARHRLNIGT